MKHELAHVSGREGGGRVKVLELFSGPPASVAGGWSNPWRANGHDVLTLDADPAFGADFAVDVLTWDPADLPWRPDVVLASPPCEGFSVMRIGTNWTHDHQPKTSTARLGVRLVERTLELVRLLEPAYFIVENPRAKLRRLPVVADLERRTITYCQYGEARMKPTDLWGGFPPSLILRPPCRGKFAPPGCHDRAPRGSRLGVQGQADPATRARIPEQLSKAVMEAAERDFAVGLTWRSEPARTLWS